jgi:hypothetical protein
MILSLFFDENSRQNDLFGSVNLPEHKNAPLTNALWQYWHLGLKSLPSESREERYAPAALLSNERILHLPPTDEEDILASLPKNSLTKPPKNSAVGIPSTLSVIFLPLTQTPFIASAPSRSDLLQQALG